MKSTRLSLPTIQSEKWTVILLLIFIISLVAIDASFAQVGQDRQGIKKVSTNGQEFQHIPRDRNANRSVCVRIPNRSIDGTCNNTNNNSTMEWGAADIELFRELPAAYGAPDFNNDMSGNCRLSARAISNLVANQTGDLPSPRNLSSLVFTWGQFIDHDIDLTPEGETEYVPILLPANEPLFTQPIPFLRSEPNAGSGVNSQRQQENIITSWMDASQVYGSEESRAKWLRTFSGGKLKMSPGELLPYNTIDGSLDAPIDPQAPSMAGDGGGTAKVFVAGDVRANEQPGLTSLHTLFVREHNRVCEMLDGQGFNGDEEIYQRARKIIGGTMQNITYRHFLPALGIEVRDYSGYRPNIQPDISNIFATAAYRLGHTMVTDEIPLMDTECDPVGPGAIALLDGFFNPEVVQTYGIEPLLQGLAGQTQQKVDAKIVDNLRNFLFPVPGSNEPFGLDLASLNIQRGRDHGLPNYYAVRDYYLGEGVDNFSDITSDPQLQEALATAYGSVYDMDLWVGLLSEDPMPGSSVGPTLEAILAKQFELIRDGDYYYYRNDPILSNQEKDQIRRTSLQDIIERNTPINNLQNNVFFADECRPAGSGGGGGGGGGGRPGGGGGGGGGDSPIGSDQHANLFGAVLNLYPNPSPGNVSVEFLLEKEAQEVQLTLVDINGKIVLTENRKTADTQLYYDLEVNHLPAGIYMIVVRADDDLYTEQLVLQRD